MSLDEIRRELRTPDIEDRTDWEQIRQLLRDQIGFNAFEVWLEGVELIAVDGSGALALAGPVETSGWVKSRFGPALSACAELIGRTVRLADEPERAAVRDEERAGDDRRAVVNQQEVS